LQEPENTRTQGKIGGN